jgi:hypothetical protein
LNADRAPQLKASVGRFELNGMSEPKNRQQLVIAIVSVLLPFATVAVVLGYQSAAHASFWNSLTPDESAAGALMGFAEIVQLFLFGLIACLVGLAMACFSLLTRPKRFLVRFVGYLAVAINGFPLMIFAVTWLANHL